MKTLAVYVWPMPYRYMPPILLASHFHRSPVPLRIYRITGIGEVWEDAG